MSCNDEVVAPVLMLQLLVVWWVVALVVHQQEVQEPRHHQNLKPPHTSDRWDFHTQLHNTGYEVSHHKPGTCGLGVVEVLGAYRPPPNNMGLYGLRVQNCQPFLLQ